MVKAFTFYILVKYVILGIMYFMPTIIALFKKNEQTKLVALLNLILGFTGIGWICMLLWSVLFKRIDFIKY